MLKTLRRAVSRTLMRVRVSKFGNNHSARLNWRYKRYHQIARSKYLAPKRPLPAEVLDGARKFKSDGFLVLPSLLNQGAAARIKTEVDALFDSGKDVYEVSPGLLRLIDGAERFPNIIDLLPGRIADVIEAYYGSHFKIYNISFYRTIPDDSTPESSFLWHFDNTPDEEIKLMLYLDDVSDETGAFRFKSRQTSEKARSLGFWHRDQYDKAVDVFQDPATTVIAEGPPGTAILFQPGRVVHKATAPRRDHRDVVTMIIIPSTIPWREHFARNKHLLSTNAGLCRNPWTDEPENIGYRY